MKEFVLLFRMDITNKEAQPTKEQMDIYMQHYQKLYPPANLRK